jgi:catechol 2,3-dioxygenase-like lactoylglutathione lyase family enzyme
VILDHVALLTADLDASAARLQPLGLAPGPVEEFPGEGTREQYWGEGAVRLLVLQPLGEGGPYARALSKRGPGLHHVAVAVPDLDAFLAGVSGWLLLPSSFATRAASDTVWLARPGIGALVEVYQSTPRTAGAALEGVEVPTQSGLAHIVAQGCGGPVEGLIAGEEAWLRCGGKRHRVADLVQP